MSDDNDRTVRMQALQREIHVARAELVALLKEDARRTVDDYVLSGPDGDVRLSELFGDKDELVVSFNMGTSCPYCACWGDAVNGFVHHLQSYASFVCVSPDAPDVQAAFADARGWHFKMLSHADSDFVFDMGFAQTEDGKKLYAPGYATFRKTEDGIERVGMEWYGPGDWYNGLFHMLEMLQSGGEGFTAKIAY